MSAWSEDTFGNDAACDWIAVFLEAPGLDIVWDAVNRVQNSDDYLDSDAGCECLAACEVLARLQGHWGLRNAYSEDLDAWIEANPVAVPDELKQAAGLAMDRILGPGSELPELWDEGGRNDKWHDAIDDLRMRVGV